MTNNDQTHTYPKRLKRTKRRPFIVSRMPGELPYTLTLCSENMYIGNRILDGVSVQISDQMKSLSCRKVIYNLDTDVGLLPINLAV